MSNGTRLGLTLALIAPAALACEGDFASNPPANTAVVKFCNNRIGANNQLIDLTLEIGSPPLKISARSGTCAPAVGRGCLAIPAGAAVPMTLRQDGRELTSELLEVHDGEEWVLVAYPDAPILGGGELLAEFPCATFDWDKLR
jgi:hypothetical protein